MLSGSSGGTLASSTLMPAGDPPTSAKKTRPGKSHQVGGYRDLAQRRLTEAVRAISIEIASRSPQQGYPGQVEGVLGVKARQQLRVVARPGRGLAASQASSRTQI